MGETFGNNVGRTATVVIATLCALLVGPGLTGTASAATCTIYWTGASATNNSWTNLANWSNQDGGTQPASALPTSTDAVCMSSSPAQAAVTIPADVSASANTIDFPATATGSGATVLLTVSASAASLTLYGSGSTVGNLTLLGTLTGPASSGPPVIPTITVTGTFELGGSPTGSDPLVNQVHLINQGAATEASTAGSPSLNGNAVFENAGLLTLTDANNFGKSGAGSLVNDSSGSISYNASTTSSTSSITVPTTNNGVISVDQGVLQLPMLTNFSSGALTGGSYFASNGATMELPGLVQTIAASTSMFLDSTAGSRFTDAQLNNALASVQTNAGTLSLGQSLSLSGALSNTGTLSLSGGTLTTPSLSSSGFVGVVGASLRTSSGSFSNSGLVAIASNGTLNAGTSYLQTGSSSSTSVDTGSSLTVNGGSGTADIQGGTLLGTGAVKANVINDGSGSSVLPIFETGGAPLTVTGNYDNSTGTLEIEMIGTTTPGVDFGQLAVNGTATLSGTLTLAAVPTTCPANGAQITILKAGSVSGTFSTVNQPLASSCHFNVSYTATSVVLTAAPGSPPPPPPPPPAPTVAGVSPQLGLPGGGGAITITGSHFTGATAVHFGGAAATGFKVLSDGAITATSPAGSGTVDVTVTTAGGTSATSSHDLFTYIPQSVISTVNGAISSLVNVLSHINPAAAAKNGKINLQVGVGAPGTLNLSLTALANVHVASDQGAEIARLLKKGTVLARGKVVAKHAGKAKLTMKLTPAGKKALKKLSSILPVQLTANLTTPQGVSYTGTRVAHIRPRHHAGTVRGKLQRRT